jgi:hypothetical protein
VKLTEILVANQQGTPTEGELGWLAGIIEGEGTITMNVRKKAWKGWKGVGVDLTVAVVNTDGAIIERVADIIRRLVGGEPYIYQCKNSPIPNRNDPDNMHVNLTKTILNVSVNRMADIIVVLKAIEPQMAGEKGARARLMTRFIERRMSRRTEHTKHGMALFDKFDWETVAEFYKLKRRPIPPEVVGLLNEQERDRVQ